MFKNIWVIQTAFLGDCVLSLPFLYRLAELCPEATIHVITSAPGREIMALALERGLAPYRKRIRLHLLDKKGRHRGFWALRTFARELRAQSPHAVDAVFCLQRSARSGLLALLSGAEKRVGFSSGSASFFYNLLVPRQWNSGQSEVEKNLDLLRALVGKERVPEWSPVRAPSLLRDEQLSRAAEPSVALALGSPWPTKRWPEANAADLACRVTALGVEVKLLGDPKSLELARKVKELCPNLLVKDHVGQTDLRAWVELIQLSKVLVCNDSAATHVGADLGVPSVVLFGPTLAEFGFAPWRKSSVALGLGQLPCRPCHIHGPRECPEKHHLCLKNLSAEVVFRHVFKLLQMR